MKPISIGGACLALLVCSAASAAELTGTISYDLDAEDPETTYLTTGDGARYALEGEDAARLRVLKRPSLGWGDAVDHPVTIEGELDGDRLRITRVVSPRHAEVTGVVQGQESGTQLRVDGRDRLVYGGAGFIVRAGHDQKELTVRGWLYPDKVVVAAVKGELTRRVVVQKHVPMLTMMVPVKVGLMFSGRTVWLSAHTGDAWGGYYLHDRGGRYVPRDAVSLARQPQPGGVKGLANLGQ